MSDTTPQKTVVKEEARYVIQVDGAEAGYAEFVENGSVRDFNHTVVDSAYQGQGLSKLLIKEALDDTREAGMTIIPTCTAVEGFIAKNPEYQDLVKK
ncbi:N-acetyltransferase [Corynebacterium sp. 320]|uniref:N-acetyltransferase n=1 Tax=Corynebacterium zhongnanshanii TaxID=2768834 RepID=A0ABQ6VCK0_9CORY|nr:MULTISPECIES: GNAT family N-acetyltransferase [Corynebacterium]KAB1502989.1 N-acetyltransferase [Corynebacterium sp. 320]KAB1550800.1 N-acetyltransferase [Corynebacterium sp. 321]KAB1551157.1 N-acetyltransferase [Corynebacterium sp. 319]KAB3519785.1 N-acetyltransferase [Corynebacterium zhongnanshanii]KAB3526786.1 N-acetyltransferase [Corynebacterium sp. 250]